MKTPENAASDLLDPYSDEHLACLDGDGVFGVCPLEYACVQSPPRVWIDYYICQDWPDGPGKTRIYAVSRRDANGNVVRQAMSCPEVLWAALLSYCESRNDKLLYDLRGNHRIRIDSGFHDGKHWEFRGSTSEQAVKKAALTVMPGYWSNVPALAASPAESSNEGTDSQNGH